jgi:hypothetical protein
MKLDKVMLKKSSMSIAKLFNHHTAGTKHDNQLFICLVLLQTVYNNSVLACANEATIIIEAIKRGYLNFILFNEHTQSEEV